MRLEARFQTNYTAGMFVGCNNVEVFAIPPARRPDVFCPVPWW